ncbi:MAG: hypothetical protein P8Z80_01400 [Pseudolabrys sp.]
MQVRPGGPVIVIEPLAAGSFFRCRRPVDDETEVRAQAIAAIKALVEAGGARLLGLKRWDRVNRFDGLDGFIDYLLAVDPGRAALVKERAAALTRSWRGNIDVVGGKAVLVQPVICWVLARDARQ